MKPASPLNTARVGVRLAKLARRLRRTSDPWKREGYRFEVLRQAGLLVYPDYRLTEYQKSWFTDTEFFATYRRFFPDDRSADRKFFLRELLGLVDHLEGDTAEAGVFTGLSSLLICRARRGRSTHWGFDSFRGLSEPDSEDGDYWSGGNLRASEEEARSLLEPYGARVVKGWIPEVFEQASVEQLVFSHIDVDLREPTLDSLEFFYPRTVSGGVIVCDDYGFDTCPGARRAVDEFMGDRPERVIHCPTGQGIIVRR